VIAATAGRLTVHRPSGFRLDVEVELPPGSTTALLGPNGAGKSTVISAIAGLLRLDGGRLLIDDEVVDDAESGQFVTARDRRVGVVFQDALLFGHLDVTDNVAFGPRSRGASRADARRHATAWLERVGVAELASRRPSMLSGGQAQRVALCRALASEPRLLLLDEPLSALDVGARASLRRTLTTHLADLEAPRLLVTHDPIEAFLLADRVAIIEGGQLTQVGTPDEIRQRPRTTYAAELAGTNLLRGTAHAGEVTVGDHVLQIADTSVAGPVLLTVHPHSIALATSRPAGSPRNVWRARIELIERLGDRVRVVAHEPLSVTAEVTPGAIEELDISPGRMAWFAVKATEFTVVRDT
jgi:molybdate transport system ATP-binding protein